MGIIEIKRRELDAEGGETVYDGPPQGYTWSAQARFIGRLRESIGGILARNGRRIDNLYVRKQNSQRWHLFTSNGDPEIAFYFYYDAYGYNTYIFIGWQKLKTQAFIDLPEAEQDAMLADRTPMDPLVVWKKERSLSTMGELLSSMPADQVDTAIAAIGPKLIGNVSKMLISGKTIGKMERLLSALDGIGTPGSSDLRARIVAAFQKAGTVSMLKDIRDRSPNDAWVMLQFLRNRGYEWPDMVTIERSIAADHPEITRRRVREAWWPWGRRNRMSDADASQYIDEWDDDPLSAVFSLWHAGDSVTDHPLLKKHVDDNKRDVVVELLKRIRDAGESYDESGISLLSRLRDIEVDWPELDIVENSLRADGRIGESNMISEDLGNLAQLGVGNLINVLKQSASSGRRGSHIGPVGRRFYSYEIGSTSEIRDIGVLKKGMTTLRKAFKDNEGAAGFAVYIGGQAVMFGVTDAYNLGGSSRDSKIAYDLSRYQDAIDRFYAKTYNKPSATTQKTREPYSYELNVSGKPAKPRQYAGDLIDTGRLSTMLELIMAIGKETNQPVTAKLVMTDREAMVKSRARRLSRSEIENGTKDLKTRLAIYKNSKNPTVDTVEEFVAMSLRKPGAKVRFANNTYNLQSSGYDKIEPANLLRGKPFKTSYRSAEPNSYDTVDITYKYDWETNQLLPIYAEWTERTGSTREYSKQSAVLDPKLYLLDLLGTRTLDKNAVMPRLLKMFKDGLYKQVELAMSALVKAGIDWPEFAVIRNSLDAEKNNL